MEFQNNSDIYLLNNVLISDINDGLNNQKDIFKNVILDVILDGQNCPSCDGLIEVGICFNCGYGGGEMYMDKKIIRQFENRNLHIGNGKKYFLKSSTNKNFYYYDYKGRIKNDNAELELNINNERVKFYLDYKIDELGNGKIVSGLKVVGNVFIQKKVKGKKTWVEKYFDFNLLRKYAFIVLNDYRFNEYIISK